MLLQEADAAAAAIMTTTEGAVRTEMEAKGIYEQVRLAVEAAQRGKMDQLASKSVDIEMESEEESAHTGVPEEKKDIADQHRVCTVNQNTLLTLICMHPESLMLFSKPGLQGLHVLKASVCCRALRKRLRRR